MANNTRRIIDIIEYINTNKIPGIVLSLDAEKAFDRIDWPYLDATLEAFGFGGRILRAVKALYTRPTAKVIHQGFPSELFKIKSSTRQGCPLSPLLFVLCMEPLASQIRNNQDIAGIQIQSQTHKAALYADDIILTVSQPLTSLPNLFDLLGTFNDVSGFKINLAKSEALNIQSLKYLGMNLTKKCKFVI